MKRRLFLAIGILALCLPLFVSAGSSGYFPHALGDFDGSSDYLRRTSDLAGNANTKLGIISFWFRLDGGDGSQARFIMNDSSAFLGLINTSNKFRIRGQNAGTKLDVFSNTAYTADGTWKHFLASWDLGNGKAYIYVNDAADIAAGPTIVNSTIGYAAAGYTIGAVHGGPEYWNGALSEFYANFAAYLDISVEANRRLFIDGAGNPVNLGPDGSFPTGTAPIIYMKERNNNAGINFGTGGNFTINGAPAFTLGPVPFFPLSTWTPGRGMSSGMRIH